MHGHVRRGCACHMQDTGAKRSLYFAFTREGDFLTNPLGFSSDAKGNGCEGDVDLLNVAIARGQDRAQCGVPDCSCSFERMFKLEDCVSGALCLGLHRPADCVVTVLISGSGYNVPLYSFSVTHFESG